MKLQLAQSILWMASILVLWLGLPLHCVEDPFFRRPRNPFLPEQGLELGFRFDESIAAPVTMEACAWLSTTGPKKKAFVISTRVAVAAVTLPSGVQSEGSLIAAADLASLRLQIGIHMASGASVPHASLLFDTGPFHAGFLARWAMENGQVFLHPVASLGVRFANLFEFRCLLRTEEALSPETRWSPDLQCLFRFRSLELRLGWEPLHGFVGLGVAAVLGPWRASWGSRMHHALGSTQELHLAWSPKAAP